jgi:uncharacterized protein with NAD-binding domain and iron-sulfur cluster
MGKKRIAILGGGMGSLTAAFELTDRPGWADEYEITVYQTGWRLGGKGASGRNRERHQRIEEHGLHLMFGFYDNVFRIMKQAYDELGRTPGQPLATWKDAFKPHDLIVMMQKVGAEFVPWEVCPLRNSLEPGRSTGVAGPFEHLIRLLERAVGRYHTGLEANLSEVAGAPAELAAALHGLASKGDRAALLSFTSVCQVRARGVSVVDVGTLPGMSGAFAPAVLEAIKSLPISALKGLFLDLAHHLARTSPKPGPVDALDSGERDLIPWLLREFLHWLWHEVKLTERELCRLRIELDFMLTIAIGLIADRVIDPPIDWFKINDVDFKDWLSGHGANEETLSSPLISGLYDAIFSTDFRMAAGTMVHLLLLMGSEYKGSVLYKMQAGMGDTIFTPLYQVLEGRGVKFEFFHTVNNLALSNDGKQIQRVEMGVQATLKEGVEKYDPLVEVKGLMCWPSAPHFDQLEQGHELIAQKIDLENFWSTWQDVASRTLEAGRDFDTCVLGISIGAFPFICKELIDKDPRWKSMVDGVRTCQTAALQLWFSVSLAQTGWKTLSKEDPVVIPYVEPLDTWCSMDQLIDKEDWPADHSVGSLHYLCSNMPDDEEPPVPSKSDHRYPERQAKRVKELSLRWLETNVRGLWPRATLPGTPDELNWSLLVDPEDRPGPGPERLHSQFWHAVNSPSERYVLSIPGDTRFRLRPDDSGFSNLVLAGDWTLTGLSAGCLEATAMSGIMAATAVDGHKRFIAYDWLPPPVPKAPPFIPRDGVLMATSPVSMKTTLHMFLLDADMAAIGKLCDTYLNLGGERVYRPLVPWICLYCSSAESAPVDPPIGSCPEKDFGFWVPVVAGRMEGPLFVPEKIQIFTPYLWVDSGVAMLGGHDVYGFPKQLGKLTMPDAPSQQARFTVDTLVIPLFGRDSRVVEKRILDIQRVDESVWDVLEQLWADGETILEAIYESVAQHGPGRIPVPGWELFRQLLGDIFGRELPMVFLKEFPGVELDGGACYQAIVEAPVKITSGITGGRLPGLYQIDLWSFDSHQIAKNLGLRAEQEGNRSRMRSLAHAWVKFDGIVEGGKVVYERGQKR